MRKKKCFVAFLLVWCFTCSKWFSEILHEIPIAKAKTMTSSTVLNGPIDEVIIKEADVIEASESLNDQPVSTSILEEEKELMDVLPEENNALAFLGDKVSIFF